MGDKKRTVIPTKNVIKKFLNKGFIMTIEVQVRNNNVEKAIRVLKKEEIQKDGMMRELRQRQYYEKPTLKRQRKLKESLRRVAKENRLREKYL